jgi:hypothetical protein
MKEEKIVKLEEHIDKLTKRLKKSSEDDQTRAKQYEEKLKVIEKGQ